MIDEKFGGWFLVANSILHMKEAEIGDETWWCVDRRAKKGDVALLYKPLKGVILLLELTSDAQEKEWFCRGFGMGTASVKVLEKMEPPVAAKSLKKDPLLRQQNFVRVNFQKKSFRLSSGAIVERVRGLHKQETGQGNKGRT